MNANWFKIVLKVTDVQYGKNLLMKGIPLIYNKRGARLTIGDNCTIKSSFLSNLVGLYSRTIIVTRNSGAYIHIGNNVGISSSSLRIKERLTIGNNVNIGGNCIIIDTDSHPINYLARRGKIKANRNNLYTTIQSAPIVIEDDVWIGANSIVLKGVTIGARSVIGAGSVVHGTFPDNVIIAGNPAKIIKQITAESNV